MSPRKQLPKQLQRSEHDEQRDFFSWIAVLPAGHPVKLAFAVPNGARTSISVAKRLKAEGLRAGVPDVVLPVARGDWHGLFIEFKRVGGHLSDVSAVQAEWGMALMEQGFLVFTCFGFEEARTTVLDYLSNRIPRS